MHNIEVKFQIGDIVQYSDDVVFIINKIIILKDEVIYENSTIGQKSFGKYLTLIESVSSKGA